MAHQVRDLDRARTAFEALEADSSRDAHSLKFLKTEAEEKHAGAAGEYIQAIVFGGLDGILTTFAVIVAAAAAGLTRRLILIIAAANLVPEAVGMGVTDYASSLAEQHAENAERKREEWEMENKPEAEQEEMVECYKSNGYSQEESKEIVDILWSASKPAFLEIMLIKELAFVILGAFPLLPDLFSAQYDIAGKTDGVFWASMAVFAVTLFILGAFKGKIGGKRWWATGLTMLLNGAIVAAVSFGIGYGMEHANVA
eukprot:TRINITY_DN335_c0_g2_i1.p1 TRINITY_DN335_c0_g2~~TRINITY_DN335_c0_g2_i1.p1  ORF type:complete len:256 (-),score=93.20 TRINITY_DN335_c0_g2_i1:336-1103(-)